MNEYDLFDAMNGIDDDLLLRSESRAVRKFPIRRALIAAAAVMALAVTAMASPAVRHWFSRSTATEESDANIIRWQITETDENGESYTYEVDSYQNSVARIDMDLEGIGQTPETILELRAPTYFESGGWEYLPDVRYPDDMSDRYIGQWNRWTAEGNQYVFFQQNIIYPATEHTPAGYGQFYIGTGNNGPIAQTTMTIDELEYQVYLVGDSVLGDMTYGAHTHVVWCDGEYAYLLSTENVTQELIADIIRSIKPIQDHGSYIRDAVYDPIEVCYTLAAPADGLVLSSTSHNGYSYWQSWMNQDQTVIIRQNRIQSAGSDVDNRDLAFTLDFLRRDYPDAKIDIMEIDGKEVTILWASPYVKFDPAVYVYWTADGYDFTLTMTDPDTTLADVADLITGLVPAENMPE